MITREEQDEMVWWLGEQVGNDEVVGYLERAWDAASPALQPLIRDLANKRIQELFDAGPTAEQQRVPA